MFKNVEPTGPHVALRTAIIRLIQREHPTITPEDCVAVLSFTVGQLIAMCDQRKFTPDMLLRLVQTNIELGNAEAMSNLIRHTEGNA